MLSVCQMQMLRAVLTQGWPCDLISHLLIRSNASDNDWQQLVSSELVEKRDDRFYVSKKGRSVYRRLKKSVYF